MAWLESHLTLENHPKLILLCNKTGWNINEAIGILHRLWWWTLTYAEDGDLNKYDPSQFLGRLNGAKDPKELLKIMQECQFIDSDNKIHNWLDYTGRYLTTKYRTSKPQKLKDIEKKYKSDFRRTKSGLQSDQIRLDKIRLDKIKKPDNTKDTIQTNPEIKIFIDWFFQEFQNRYGEKYLVTGKDASITKRLLGTYDLENLKTITLKFFDCEDDFIRKAGYTIPILSVTLNKVISARPNEPKGYAGLREYIKTREERKQIEK